MRRCPKRLHKGGVKRDDEAQRLRIGLTRTCTQALRARLQWPCTDRLCYGWFPNVGCVARSVGGSCQAAREKKLPARRSCGALEKRLNRKSGVIVMVFRRTNTALVKSCAALDYYLSSDQSPRVGKKNQHKYAALARRFAFFFVSFFSHAGWQLPPTDLPMWLRVACTPPHDHGPRWVTPG